MRILTAIALAVCCLAQSVSAVTIDTVPVGNAGNLPDANGRGAVAYDYRMGTYEVTIGQYTEFLNAVADTDPYGLYSTQMATVEQSAGILRTGASGNYAYAPIGSPNRPIANVSWADAARFANWMHNGQPTGPQDASTTEDGAYSLNGATHPLQLRDITRNAVAQWFIPTEEEWYKAAFHKNDGPTGNYWSYATSSDVRPYSDQPPGNDAPVPSNTANVNQNDGIANGYNDGFAVTGSTANALQNYLTDVAAYPSSLSPYGTLDQGGNVLEWNETAFPNGRGFMGDSWISAAAGSAIRGNENPNTEVFFGGFRLAAAVPEPASSILFMLGIAVLLSYRRIQRHRIRLEANPAPLPPGVKSIWE